MPPKKGPKARKLCVELPAKTEIPASRIFSAVKIVSEIGRGGFGRIYSGKVKDSGEDVAVKVEAACSGGLFVELKIFQDALSRKSIDAYTSTHKLSFLGVPYCVGFGVFTFKNEDLRFVAMPLYKGSLQQLIDSKAGKVLKLADCVDIVPGVVDVYDYLHSSGITHADLKAENLMFPLKGDCRLDRLTLVDYGIAGRRTEHALEQPVPAAAHNGTPLYTSIDAHRGCKPSFRADYEILGHNLLVWLVGLPKTPWNACVDKLDKVHQLKSKMVADPEEVHKLTMDENATALISGIYKISSSTPYSERVNTAQVKKLISKARSGSGSVRASGRKRIPLDTKETSNADEVNVIPGTPEAVAPVKKARTRVANVPKKHDPEVLKKTSAKDREARLNRRHEAQAKGANELSNTCEEDSRPLTKQSRSNRAVEEASVNLDETLPPDGVEHILRLVPGASGLSRITRKMGAKYGIY